MKKEEVKTTTRAWEKMPRESSIAHSAFNFWLEFGEERSPQVVADKFDLKVTRVRAWMKRFLWNERLSAWNSFILAVQQKAIAQRAKETAESWADRRIFIQEKEYELGKKLMEKAEMMLQFDPVEKVVIRTERVIKDGVEIDLPVVTELRPNKWGWRDANAVLETGAKLMRMSAEMATSHEAVQVNVTQGDNLGQARLMLERLQKQVMDRLKDAPPNIDRTQIMKSLPAMAAKEWGVEESELIPLSEQPAIEVQIISSEEVDS